MFAVVDVEASGGRVSDNRITEIAVVLFDGEKIIDRFSSLINPQREITPYVVELTGITNKMVQKAPLFEEIAEEFESKTKDAILVAHNIGVDYNIIRREFKRIGKSFRRDSLCTVQLSQKILKNQTSFSLGTLTKNLGIEIRDRHRALGDAEATVYLLKNLIEEKGLEYIVEQKNSFKNQIKYVPKNLKQEIIEQLPEEPGVFRLLDKEKKPLLIRSAKNIYNSVLHFFNKELDKYYFKKLLNEVFFIEHEVVNSFIISQLQEFHEIKNKKPSYNKSSLYKSAFPLGIYKSEENQLVVKKTTKDLEPLWKFSHKRQAYRFLKRIKEEYPQLQNNQASYEDIDVILQKKLFPAPNFFIVRRPYFSDQAYVIQVKDYKYVGFGKTSQRFLEGLDMKEWETLIKPTNYTPGEQRILVRYVNKKNAVSIEEYL